MFVIKNTRLAFNLVTISHTLFVLPLVFSGFFIGIKEVDIFNIFLIILATLGARNIGFIFNRWIDREIDSKNPRTSEREIPSGKVGKKFIVIFFLISTIIFFLSTWFLCKEAIFLALIPIVLFFIYPFLKRYTFLCHYFLGFSLSLAPLAGFFVSNCSYDEFFLAIPISIFTIFWIGGFDILYALQDIESDIANNVYSVPSVFGKKIAVITTSLSFLLAILSLIYFNLNNLDSSLFGYFLILIISINFTVQIIYVSRDNYDFFKYNSYVGFLILLLAISDIFT
jgi:4-hydroxybenzoate polyprenyltransferase